MSDGARAAGPDGSPWWSDARNDPWRDPTTHTEIVVPAPATPRPGPQLEPVADPDAATGQGANPRLVPVMLITALVVGMVAGALGGALGYTYAQQRHQGTVLGAGGNPGPDPAEQPPPESTAEVVDQVAPSVVTVRSGRPAGGNLGSGFLVSAEGHVLTNDHVVGENQTAASVTYHDGNQTEATVVGRDRESDLAVLLVEEQPATPAPVRLGDSDTVVVGEPVLAFGSPLALANTVTSGIVSALDRTIQAGGMGSRSRYYAAIQTDAAVNQGNSGGPLVDTAGRVIGVNSVIRSVASTADEAASIGLAFAIPINQATRIAQEIIDTGEARRTVLGAELGPQMASGGVRLTTVVPDGPADQAGLQDGDVVVRFDGRPVEEPADLIALVRKHAPGAAVPIEYSRGGSNGSVTVTLAADTG